MTDYGKGKLRGRRYVNVSDVGNTASFENLRDLMQIFAEDMGPESKPVFKGNLMIPGEVIKEVDISAIIKEAKPVIKNGKPKDGDAR